MWPGEGIEQILLFYFSEDQDDLNSPERLYLIQIERNAIAVLGPKHFLYEVDPDSKSSWGIDNIRFDPEVFKKQTQRSDRMGLEGTRVTRTDLGVRFQYPEATVKPDAKEFFAVLELFPYRRLSKPEEREEVELPLDQLAQWIAQSVAAHLNGSDRVEVEMVIKTRLNLLANQSQESTRENLSRPAWRRSWGIWRFLGRRRIGRMPPGGKISAPGCGRCGPQAPMADFQPTEK